MQRRRTAFNQALADFTRTNPEAWRGWLAEGSREDWSGQVGVLPFPALIIAGAEDLEAFDSLDAADRPADGVVLTIDELAEQARQVREQDPRATENPAVTATLPASTRAFYVFTSGTTGMPKASIMTHYRWLKGMAGFGATGVRMRGQQVTRAGDTDGEHAPILRHPGTTQTSPLDHRAERAGLCRGPTQSFDFSTGSSCAWCPWARRLRW